MAHSTRGAESQKLRKPNDSYPLTPRGDGRWCKRLKVGGRWQTFYFRGTSQEALDEWNRTKDDLLAGRRPADETDAITVRTLCNKFLQFKRAAVDVGTINARTFIGYNKATDALVATLGLNRTVADLKPDDFARLYRKLADKHGIATLGREITIVRSVFKYALDSDLIDKPVKFGPEFKAPSKKHKRKQRNECKRARGAKMFNDEDVRRMIESAGPQLKAMILLGINGGLGNTDCASLHLSHMNLDNGWLDYPRPKTEIDRRIPLWPETVAALRIVLANRRQLSSSENAKLVFLTRLGQPWVRYELFETKDEAGKIQAALKTDDAISKATAKLLKDLSIYRPGVTFYALRHTFEAIAGGCRDQVAVDAVMGHVDDTMAAEYREHIDDDRLRAVTDHVRAWLFPKEKKDTDTKPKRSSTKPAKAERSKEKPAHKAPRHEVAEAPLLRIVR